MNNTEIILLLVLALANLAWAFYNHVRIQNLQSQLIVSEMETADDQAHNKNHSLSEPDIDAQLSKVLGPGTKPPA